jgi:acyl-CoA reductase-like NAD-dependent aldehyde dehydrogenase
LRGILRPDRSHLSSSGRQARSATKAAEAGLAAARQQLSVLSADILELGGNASFIVFDDADIC